jgi:hypothetical protein
MFNVSEPHGEDMADAPLGIVALVFTDARPARDPQIDSLRAACAARP